MSANGKSLPKIPEFSRVVSKRAFTLIELLTVITVIGVLAAITFGISRSVRDSQNRTVAKAELAVIGQALESFKAKHGDYPWTGKEDIADSDQAAVNGKILFRSLTGWMKFAKDADGDIVLAEKPADELHTSVKKPFLDPDKLTYVDSENSGTLNPYYDVSMEGVPTDYLFLDPWGEPYIYLHAQNHDRDWKVLGYLLYSKGADLSHSSVGLNRTTGETTNAYRKEAANLDNIYLTQ